MDVYGQKVEREANNLWGTAVDTRSRFLPPESIHQTLPMTHQGSLVFFFLFFNGDPCVEDGETNSCVQERDETVEGFRQMMNHETVDNFSKAGILISLSL